MNTTTDNQPQPHAKPPRGRRAALSGESGVALVEFAMVLPFLMVIVVVMFDFGRALNYWIDTTHLASEGARLAAVDKVPEGASLQEYIRSKADTVELREGTGSVAEALEVCVTSEGDEVGDPVEVEVRTTYNLIPLVPVPDDLTALTIHGTATMRRERLATNVTDGCG